jgi:hypothetical protein
MALDGARDRPSSLSSTSSGVDRVDHHQSSDNDSLLSLDQKPRAKDL